MSDIAKKPDQTSPESYSPKKPEIVNMMKESAQSQKIKGLTENVLQGIPFMGYGNPSAVCYIGSVIRLMEYLHDPIEEDELFSLSGAALCFPWKAGLCCDEISILPEIPKRTFTALGYESEYIYESNIHAMPREYTKEFYINKIKSSIDSGRPVIGFGFTELNFTCLITGYFDNSEGLYLRSYWSPKGLPEGYDQEQYYRIYDWYDKCHGLIIIGEKTAERLTSEQAYRYIKENAKIFREKETETAQWNDQPKMIFQGASAFDDMVQWLLDDNWWQDDCDMNYRDCLLKPCGLLLLDYYRSHLHGYLGRLSEQNPDLVNPKIRPAIENLGSYITGPNVDINNLSTLDPAITDFSYLKERTHREKIADLVMKLKELDKEIFNCILN